MTDAPRTSVRTVVGLLVLFEVTSGFLQTSLLPLLPDLGDRLGVSDADLTWVTTVQLLAAAVSVPVLGRLGDRYGHRRVLRASLIALAIGSVLVAVAPSLPVLLAGRALQGTLAALLPLEMGLVRDRLPQDDARRAIARLVAALTLGGVLGGVVTGAAHALVDDVAVVLWLPALAAIVCVPISFLRIPESTRRAPGGVDWAGAGTLAIGMVALLGAFSLAEDGSLAVGGGLLVLAVATLAVFVRIELRIPEPLVDLRLLASRAVAPLFGVAFAFGFVYFGSQAVASPFLAADPETAGYGFDLSAFSISVLTLPSALAALAGSALTTRLAARLGYPGTLVAAFGAMSAGFVLLAGLHTAVWQVVVANLIAGLGAGVALGAMPTVIVEAGPHARTAVTGALYNNVKTLGGAVAGALFAAVLSAVVTDADAHMPAESGYVIVWLLAAAATALAAAGMVVVRRRVDVPLDVTASTKV
ncbi:MFS transporter [Cryptosporangium aurantiacum]|uniref:Predicted arabinose efflux permease, MFS family n=1 Tax=Cryptosporangium aurantiacum TaxID=134849 RepID=A0A1M7RLS1_9ACTN|nr:MFS transporter [Cryptosporangium aurantiacum]SHN47267.1 Predicted arabinose efflux permease, MFS family [Cryptosporangium aurantiacum]